MNLNQYSQTIKDHLNEDGELAEQISLEGFTDYSSTGITIKSLYAAGVSVEAAVETLQETFRQDRFTHLKTGVSNLLQEYMGFEEDYADEKTETWIGLLADEEFGDEN